MFRTIAFTLATTALVGGATLALAAAPATQAKPAALLLTAAQAAASTGAQYGTFGFDLSGMDRSVAPGDNFYYFANGTWAKNTAIPPDQSSYGSFNYLDDLSHTRTRGILEQAKADPNSKIGRAYSTYLDTAAIEGKGLAPVEPLLTRIRALKSKAGYPALAAAVGGSGVGIPFAAFVNQDQKDPDTYIMRISQAGLGMPDRDYYLSADPKLAATKSAYQKHVAAMLTLAGETNAAARARAIGDFETKIAQVSWTRVQSRDANKTYNKMTLVELDRSAPGFDFAGFFRAAHAPVKNVNVAQPTAVSGIAKVIQGAPLGVLKDQPLLRSLDSFADVLPSAFDQEDFAFFG